MMKNFGPTIAAALGIAAFIGCFALYYFMGGATFL